MMSTQLYTSLGKPVYLGDMLGSPGTEGAVYEVTDRPNVAAKLYHSQILAKYPDKPAKLAAMARLSSERLLQVAAWPFETIHQTTPGGQVAGFLMPLALGYKDVHKLYGVKSRKAEYPEARWPFLIHAASNVARAFHVVHESGHVIGDVNERGVLVSNKATVMLVDCDSFQVTANGQKFLCDLGVPTHTPPELQGRAFHGIVRTTNHDAFGLAVIVFQLLFLGRHPFSGGFLGSGEMPLEQAIAEYRFAYGSDAASRMMDRPPGTLPFEAISPDLQVLFRRAFLSRGNSRPRVQEWLAPLSDLSKSLKQCQHNSGHYFLKNLAQCPWCTIEISSGIPVFYPIFVGVAAGVGGFNIVSVWPQILAIPEPGAIPPIPTKASQKVTLSAGVKKMKLRRLVRTAIVTAVVAAMCALFLVSPLGSGLTLFSIVVVSLIAIPLLNLRHSDQAKELLDKKNEATRKWKEVEEQWRAAASNVDFHLKKKELEKKKTEYESLPHLLKSKLNHLKSRVREMQLERFLDRFRIDRATIGGIGHARRITLRSYGIETAADVNLRAVLAIPGFGPVYASTLVAWRHSVEQGFRFDPNRGVDPADKQAIQREVGATRVRLERELQNGVAELRQISYRLNSSRELMRKHMDAAINKLTQAEFDSKAGVGTTKRYLPLLGTAGLALVLVFPIKGGLQISRSTTSRVSPSPSPQPSLQAPSSVETTETKARVAYEYGVSETKSGRFKEAVPAYREAIALKPDYQQAYHELGYALYRLRKFDEAIDASQHAVSLNSADADSYRNLGLAYEGLERWTDAQAAYRAALRIEPNHPGTYFNLGRSFSNSGDSDQAVAAYKEAVRLKPKFANAHYELGVLYADNGDADAAFAEYEILVPINQSLAAKLYAKLNQN